METRSFVSFKQKPGGRPGVYAGLVDPLFPEENVCDQTGGTNILAFVILQLDLRGIPASNLRGANQFWRSVCLALGVLFTNIFIICGH